MIAFYFHEVDHHGLPLSLSCTFLTLNLHTRKTTSFHLPTNFSFCSVCLSVCVSRKKGMLLTTPFPSRNKTDLKKIMHSTTQ